MKESKIYLPKKVGVWVRPDSPQMIDEKNIFDYMNGAGELYLSYRFNHLEVYEYTAKNQYNILVELYFMETSDDAFGLLSLDWGGEPALFNQSCENKKTLTPAPSSRALYGNGLLRIWSDNLYARVMAYRETPSSKEAVLTLGEEIIVDRRNPPAPELLAALTPTIGSDWTLRRDRINYFRSYLVLNSLYYLSNQNILNLDLSAEAVTASYENTTDKKSRKRVQFLFVKYSNPENAKQAMGHFFKAYLHEYRKDFKADLTPKRSNFIKIEDGWLGYKLYDRNLVLVFECPDQESAQKIINQTKFNL